MPSLTLGTSAAGPLVSLYVGPSIPLQAAMKAAGQTPPTGVSGTFLVDTGASHTVIDSRLVQPMGLSPTGTVMCHTPSTGANAVPMYQYDLMLFLPGTAPHPGWLIEALAVTESSFAGQQIDGLIGRDVIDRGMLVYNGQAGHFTLCY